MPGPTTEVLNDDLKAMRDEVHRIDLDVRELITRIKGITTGIKVLAVFALASLCSGIWWGSSLTTRFDGMDKRFDKLETRIERVETKINHFEVEIVQFKAAVESRFDRLESAINKLIEQTKPAPK